MARLIFASGKESYHTLPGLVDTANPDAPGKDGFEVRGIAKPSQGSQLILSFSQRCCHPVVPLPGTVLAPVTHLDRPAAADQDLGKALIPKGVLQSDRHQGAVTKPGHQ